MFLGPLGDQGNPGPLGHPGRTGNDGTPGFIHMKLNNLLNIFQGHKVLLALKDHLALKEETGQEVKLADQQFPPQLCLEIRGLLENRSLYLVITS